MTDPSIADEILAAMDAGKIVIGHLNKDLKGKLEYDLEQQIIVSPALVATQESKQWFIDYWALKYKIYMGLEELDYVVGIRLGSNVYDFPLCLFTSMTIVEPQTDEELPKKPADATKHCIDCPHTKDDIGGRIGFCGHFNCWIDDRDDCGKVLRSLSGHTVEEEEL